MMIINDSGVLDLGLIQHYGVGGIGVCGGWVWLGLGVGVAGEERNRESKGERK